MSMQGLSSWDTEPAQWYRYNGKERDTLSGWTDFGARWGILEIGRWNGVDPLASKYTWSSPYSYCDGNPIIRTDPDGADWFKDENGKTVWHEATGKAGEQVSLKGLAGNWTNIGTEFIEFNGQSLIYSWQTIGENGKPFVQSQFFDAVSGKGQDPTKYWNLERYFDYSKERQSQANLGPTPEGLYSINKTNFVENSNEGGTQRWQNLALYEKAVASLGRSSWPGGTSSWGAYRWKLQNEGAETFGRDNFYLHGGYLWGSRGCIDVGAGISTFYNSFITTNKLGNDKVFLKVSYEKDLLIKAQNTPTSSGLNIIRQ